MSDLVQLVEPLKRAMAGPGAFDALFPESLDTDLSASLLDAFAEAQLYGFFVGSTATDAGVITPGLTRGEGALVVIFGACRILTSEIRNRKTHIRYEASGAVFEQDQSAAVLVQLLRDYQAQKVELLKRASYAASAFYMADQYFLRAVGSNYAYSGGF